MKKIICSLLLISVCFSLVSCSLKNNSEETINPSVFNTEESEVFTSPTTVFTTEEILEFLEEEQQTTTKEESTTKKETTSKEKTTQSTSVKSDASWATAYKDYLLQEYYNAQENMNDEDSLDILSSTFSLYYIDNDDIPEVVISQGEWHFASAKILTYHNGTVYASERMGSFGVVYFRERENVIIGNYIGMGSHSMYVYHIENGKVKEDWNGRHDYAPPEGYEISYYSNDNEVSEDEFNSVFNHYIPEWYDPLNENIDACPINDGSISEKINMDAVEINKYFNKWIS